MSVSVYQIPKGAARPRFRGSAALALLGLILGCRGGEPGPPPPPSPSGAPFPAAGGPALPAPQGEAIHFSRLTRFAPDRLAEWTGGRLSAATSRFGSTVVTEVERPYALGERRASLRLVDTTLNRGARAPPLGDGFEDERRAGKPLLLEGARGFAELDKESGRATVNLVVADRIVLTLSCDGSRNPLELERLAAALDLGGLAELARAEPP